MKKLILTFTVLVLIAMLSVSVYASTNALKVSNSGGQLGHTVFLTVTLTESIAGDTLGITYDFDDKVLEALPELCEWEKTGVLQDFSKTSSAGVWATDTRKDLSGLVCTLAFKIRSDAKIGDTKVECTLIVKNGSDTVATYSASGIVKVSCDHEYGSWVSNGSFAHKHTCSLCGDTQNQTHTWNDGVTTENKDENITVYTYTCTTCGATKQSQVEGTTENTTDDDHGQGSNPATRPTEPIPTTTRPTDPIPTTTRPTDPIPTTRPTEPIPTTTRPTDPIPTTTRPTDPIPTTTRPTGTQATNPTQTSRPSNSGNGGNNDQQGGNSSGQDHEHTSGTTYSGESGMIIVPGQTENGESVETIGQNQSQPINDHDHDHDHENEIVTTQDPHAGHDHSSTTTPSANQSQRLAAAIGIFVVLGLFLVVSILVVKKKR